MVESIKELKEICQTGRTVKGRSGENWTGTLIYRKVSIYFTKLFLYTPITANQLSLFVTMLAVMGTILLAQANFILGIIAVGLIFLADVLDCTDGEVARYRKTAGERGEKIELVAGHFEIPLYWAGITYASFISTNRIEFLVAGFITILIFMKVETLKEIVKEYQNKKFQNSPKDTLKIISKPKGLIHFLAFSKYFIEGLIGIGVLFNIIPLIVLIYPFIEITAYYFYVNKWLNG